MDTGGQAQTLRSDEACLEDPKAQLTMGAYNFQSRFVPYVEDGSKTHTIRGFRRYQDKAGSTAHLFYAQRTKQCRKLFSAPVLRVERILIESYETVQNSPFARGGNHSKGSARGPEGESLLITIGGLELSAKESRDFLKRDGFRDPLQCPQYQALQFWQGSLPFVGFVIHWDYESRITAHPATQEKLVANTLHIRHNRQQGESPNLPPTKKKGAPAKQTKAAGTPKKAAKKMPAPSASGTGTTKKRTTGGSKATAKK
jgi:hypothetical protein